MSEPETIDSGTGELIVRPAGHVATRFEADQVALIKRTVCKDGTDDELRLFLTVASKTGLDPFARQIHAVHRDGVMQIQTGIDGYRLIAERTSEMDGQEGPEWCDDEGNWSDVWTEDVAPTAARVKVYRKGHSHPYTGIAHLNGYIQRRKSDGAPVKRWRDDPAGMLAKCAEALALRKAFPQELSGVYADVELDQADNPPGAPRATMPRRKSQAAQSPPPPADEPPHPAEAPQAPAQTSRPAGDGEEQGTATVHILDVSQKQGQNQSGPWTLTKAKADDGFEYRTFSPDKGAVLKACAGTDEVVVIRWKKGRYGREVMHGDDSVDVLEPQDEGPES